MQKDFHPIEIMLGNDGSCAIEGVPEGRNGARKVLEFLLGKVPDTDSFATNPLWDWLYFPPGTITQEQRQRFENLGAVHESGNWVYKLHQVPHVEQPGAYTESFYDILKEPWMGRIIAGVIFLILVGALGAFWANTRVPQYVSAGFGDVLTTARAPYEAPSFTDRIKVTFHDGARFSIAVNKSDVVHRSGDAVVLKSGSSSAYLVLSEGVGETLVNALQYPDPALRMNTQYGIDGLLIEQADGDWVRAEVKQLTVGNPTSTEADHKIRYNDPSTFSLGTSYTLEGGLMQQGEHYFLFHLPQNSPPYRVELKVDDPALDSLLGYLAHHSYGLAVAGSLAPPETEGIDRLIGSVGPNLALRFGRTWFVPKQ